jgi:hypothetical protein
MNKQELRQIIKEEISNVLNKNEAENKTLSPNMQKRFNMIVSKLKKAKSEKDLSWIMSDIVLLNNNKVEKIFIDKLIDMDLAVKNNDGSYSLYYNDNES